MNYPRFSRMMREAKTNVLRLNCGVAPSMPISGRDFVAVLQQAAHDAGFERPTPDLLHALRDMAAATNPLTGFLIPRMLYESEMKAPAEEPPETEDEALAA